MSEVKENEQTEIFAKECSESSVCELTLSDGTQQFSDDYAPVVSKLSETFGDTSVTLKLLADVELSRVVDAVNTSVVLDLNGHSLVATAMRAISVAKGGALTIIDSSEEQTGLIKARVNAITVFGGSLTIESGTIETESSCAIYHGCTGEVKIIGSHIIGSGNNTMGGVIMLTVQGAQLTVKNTTIEATNGCAIHAPLHSMIDISDSKIFAVSSGRVYPVGLYVFSYGSEVNISNTEFSCEYTGTNNVRTDTYNFCALISRSNTTITGSHFTVNNANPLRHAFTGGLMFPSRKTTFVVKDCSIHVSDAVDSDEKCLACGIYLFEQTKGLTLENTSIQINAPVACDVVDFVYCHNIFDDEQG